MRFLLISAILLGCDANLKVQTQGLPSPDCAVNPSAEGCETIDSDELPRIEIERTVSNGANFDVRVHASRNSIIESYLSSSESCQDKLIPSQSQEATLMTFTDLAEGSYYVCATARKGERMTPATNNGLKIVIDRTPPVVEALGTLYKNSSFTLHPNVQDAQAVTTVWSKKSGPGLVSFSDGVPTTVAVDGDGAYEIQLTVTDAAGNATTQTYAIVYDTIAPIVNAGPDVAKNAAFSANATVSGADLLQWSQVSGPGVVTFADRASATSGITASMDGIYVLRLTASDRAGNQAFDEFTLNWITTGPQLTSLVKAGVAADGFINAAEQGSATAVFSLNAVAYDDVAYSDPLPAPLTCNASVLYGRTTLPVASDFTSDGSYGICVHLSDLAGNHVYGASEIIERDTSAPSITTFDRLNEAANGYVNAAEITSSLPLVGLTATGAATVAYSAPLNDSALVCDGSKTYSFSTPPAVQNLPASNGAYAVCARLVDAAGNVTHGKSMQVVVDLTAPVVDAGSDITASGSANIVASTSGATAWQWTLVSGPGTLSFGSASAQNTTAVASVEGTYVLRLTATDDAGNSASDDMTYIYDATPPAFVSLVKSGDAADGYVNNAEKAGTTPLWSLSASGYTDVRYTGPLDETSPQACGGTQTYDQTVIASAANLPNADAPYVICVRLTDAANNTTYGKAQIVTRDTVSPSVSVGSDLTANAAVTVNATVSGATAYQWSKVSGSGSVTFTAANAASTSMSATSDDTYVVRLTATDAAGNSASDDLNLIWDATAPVFTSLVKAGAASDGYVNDAEKGGATALWSLNASGHASATYTGPLDDTTPVTCDGSLTYDEPAIATASDLPNADTAYVICVDLSDAAGNHTYGKSEVVVRDIVAPTVDVGSDIATNTTATIAATVSGASSLQWTKVSGTGTITFSAPTAATTDVTTSDETSYVLRLTAIDAAGNSAFDDLNFLYSTTMPTLTSFAGANEAANGYVNNAEKNSALPLLTITASNYQTIHYTVPLADSGLTCDASKTYDQTSIPAISALPAPDGLYAVCVKLVASGGGTTYGKSQSIVKDTTAPTVDAGLDITAGAAAANLNATTSGATSWSWTKQAGAGTITFGAPTAEDTTASASAQDTYTLRLTATDAAGNSAFDEMILTWDTTPPVFTSLALANEGVGGYLNSAELVATNPLWTLSASGQAATAYTIALDDTGASVACNSGKTYDQPSIARGVDIPASDKPYVICVRLTDSAGNITYGKSAQLVRDTVPPTFTSMNGANGASDGYLNASEVASTSPMFTLVGTDIAVDDFTVVLADSALTCDGTKTYNQASIPLINTTPAVDGAYAVCVRLADAAGNITYGKSQSITRDATLPTVNVGADITSNAAASITPTVGGATSYAWSKTSGTGTITFGSPSAANTTATASAQDTYVLRLTVTDVAGNSAYDELTYIYDTTPPTFTSLVLANEAVGGYINSAEASATNPLWTLNASGQSATIYSAPLDDTGSAVTCDAGKTYSPTSIARAVDLPASDKPYVICVRLTDAAGNITYGKSAQVVRDTTAPTITSFNGANAASDGYINASETGSTAAMANLVASGQTTTDFTAILSNTSLTCDGGKTYSLTAVPAINTMTATDGAYAVCVRLVDVAGNTTYGKSQVITRDTLAPTVNVGTDVWANATYSINATTSGAATYSWSKQSGPGTITFGTSTAEDTTAASNTQGLHVLRLTVTDAAGNSAYDELNFTWDTVAPVFTSLTLANQATDSYLSAADLAENNAVANAVVGSEYDDAIYQVFPAATTCSAATYTNSANVIPLAGSLSALADGSYKVCVKLTDLANNTPAYGNTLSFTLDKTSPTVGGGGLITTSDVRNGKLTLSWTAGSDAITSAENLVYSVYYSTSSSFSTLAQVEAGTLVGDYQNITTATVSNLQRGTVYYFNVVVRDQVGNKQVYTQVADKTREATFVQVDSGGSSSCGVTVEGKLYCWGANTYGQLGTGNTTTSTLPVAVNSSLRFRQVDVGSQHACALTDDNVAYCWGANTTDGRLGTGNTTSSLVPIAVNTTDRFKQIVASANHTCALRVDGAAYCWGGQGFGGNLGNGLTGGYNFNPVAVSGGLRFRKLTTGIRVTCGITDSGDAYCWGIGGEGQLGHGAAGDRSTPTLVTGGHKFKDVSAGLTHTCGLRSDGLPYCWGYDTNGALGNDAGTVDSTSPMLVSGGRRYRAVATSVSYGSCAIDEAGDLYCWGHSNTSGLSGHQQVPVLMTSTKKFRQVSGGNNHMCAVASDGDIHCWGKGTNGLLGNAATTDQAQPAVVAMDNVTGDSGWLKMAGHEHACGIRSTGKLFCWGPNGSGQVGDGTTTTRSSPTAVASSDTFIDVSVGNLFACGLKADGKVMCFGDRSNGKLGDGLTTGSSSTPINVSGTHSFVQLTSSWDFSCGIRSDGRMLCWGSDANSRLGNGAGNGIASPTVSDGTTTYLMAEAGAANGCALVDDGSVKCWGTGDHGRQGSGGLSEQASPTAISGTNKFTTLSGGGEHVCGLKSNGGLSCWGGDTYGQLGDDATLANQSTPVDVDSGNVYLDVLATEFNTCGLRADATLYCWGLAGKVGDGTTGTNRPTPVAVNLSKRFRPGTFGGYANAFGVTSDGWAYGWGDDTNDSVGIGYLSGAITAPTPVLLKVPAASIQVSSVYAGDVGTKAIDGNLATTWAGSSTSVWAELNLGRTATVKYVHMQNNNGDSVYTTTITAGPTAVPTTQYWTSSANYGAGYWVMAPFATGAVDTRFLRISIQSSYHWVSLSEIELFE